MAFRHHPPVLYTGGSEASIPVCAIPAACAPPTRHPWVGSNPSTPYYIYIASLNTVVAILSPAIAMPPVARSAAAVAISVTEGTIVTVAEDGMEVAGDIIMDIYEAVTVFLANFATD